MCRTPRTDAQRERERLNRKARRAALRAARGLPPVTWDLKDRVEIERATPAPYAPRVCRATVSLR